MNAQDKIRQQKICKRHGADFVLVEPEQKIGIARNVRDGAFPINGLRHRPAGDTTGWYIWAGEGDPSDNPDFFVPLHAHHLSEWCPNAVKFLGLPPGWRFLLGNNYEDVWEDPSLLNV